MKMERIIPIFYQYIQGNRLFTGGIPRALSSVLHSVWCGWIVPHLPFMGGVIYLGVGISVAPHGSTGWIKRPFKDYAGVMFQKKTKPHKVITTLRGFLKFFLGAEGGTRTRTAIATTPSR